MESMMVRSAIALLILWIILPPGAAVAQAAPPPAQDEQPLLKPEQLEALVAPIALYPDALLANMLAASTYPLEVVEADRWIKENGKLKGDALKSAVDKRGWDESVKALTATPSVLAMMNDKLDWTKELGDAVLAQQPDVMDAIQRLRAKAQANNKLSSTKEQKVSTQAQGEKQVILIEQTDPNTVYVPYYEPAVVYGEWPYPAYPPYYFGYPSYIGAGIVATGLAFGAGFALGRWSNYWGGGCNWGNRNFFINRSNTINNIGNNWQHNPAHRQGVRYNNGAVQQRFGNGPRAGSADRMDFRGRSGDQVLNPGKDRAGVGDRERGDRGDRAGDRGAGDRGGDRAKAANRAGGDRQSKAGSDRSRGAGNKQARGGDGSRSGGQAARGGGRDNALRTQSGRAASAQSARGRASFASASAPRGGGGAMRAGGGGGGFRGGGGGGGFRGGGGGGRRSDLLLKRDVVLLGHLQSGLGYYRFSYLDDRRTYVGVIAQEVQSVRPEAVTRGADGYLRVYYDRLGLRFQTYHDWLASGGRIPSGRRL